MTTTTKTSSQVCDCPACGEECEWFPHLGEECNCGSCGWEAPEACDMEPLDDPTQEMLAALEAREDYRAACMAVDWRLDF